MMVMAKGTKDNNDKDDEPYGESTAARLLEAYTCIAGSGSTIWIEIALHIKSLSLIIIINNNSNG